MADRSSNFADNPIGNVVKSLPLDVSSTDHTPTDVPNGFHASSDGNVIGQLRDDSADRTFPVVAGGVYPYRFKKVTKLGTTATGVFLYTV